MEKKNNSPVQELLKKRENINPCHQEIQKQYRQGTDINPWSQRHVVTSRNHNTTGGKNRASAREKAAQVGSMRLTLEGASGSEWRRIMTACSAELD